MTVIRDLISTITATNLERRNLQDQVDDDRLRIANLEERVREERNESLAALEEMEHMEVELDNLRTSLKKQE